MLRKSIRQISEAECDETIVILHSLGVAEHSNNIFGEIDFVIICKREFFALKLKAVQSNEGMHTGYLPTVMESGKQSWKGHLFRFREYAFA